jgi:flavin reductase (DIM6/NTAB) family NADH-FMN oxidoreductase RutF
MNKKEFDLLNQDTMKLNWFLGNGQAVMLSCTNAKRSINGIITVTWATPTSHEPFLLTVSVGNGGIESGDTAYRISYSLINETKEFGLNIPSSDLIESVIKVGTTHSDSVDKFAEAGLTPMDSKKISAPLISECFLNLECKVLEQFVTGDHTVFVAEPVVAYMDDDVLVEGKFAEKYCDKSNRVYLGDVITMWKMW